MLGEPKVYLLSREYFNIFSLLIVVFFLDGCVGGDQVKPEPTDSIVESTITIPSGDPTLSPLTLLPEQTSVIPTSRPETVSTPESTIYINVLDDFFIKQTVTIPVGTTVIWTHNGSSGEPHTVTSDDGAFASGLLVEGDSFIFTFNEPGTYPYICIPHLEDLMVGIIIVTEE